MTEDTQNNKDKYFSDEQNIYNKKIVSEPMPEKNIGIDTTKRFTRDSIEAEVSHKLDVSAIENFTSVSQSRNSIYALIDNMCEDSTISAVLETYAEDATERNDAGKIIWAESNDPKIASFVNFLLDSLMIDKNIFNWTLSLCKYGDIYLRLYRESEYDKDILSSDLSKHSNGLQEAVNFNTYSESDHYAHYIELMPNPADTFELTKFGKSYAYIVAPSYVYNNTPNNNYNSSLYTYKFDKKDIEIYDPTEFVHGCLEGMSSRTPEKVTIYTDDKNSNSNNSTYTVKRGQSLFYNSFKSWRQLALLQNSILLNRVTKSSIVRTISVEVGDMPKEDVAPHLQWVKQLFEQKSALDVGQSLNEYTNPGPVENNVYLSTRNGQGAVTVGQVGGDVNVGQLTDLEYFRDVLFGGLRCPKQYFGFTEDGAGFNGGQSLSIISSRYAKAVKHIQTTMCHTLTDAINLLLIDKGLNSYINRFELKMVPPTTQEEIDRRENIANRIRLVSDVMNTLNDIEDPLTRLKILKSMLSEALTNTEVSELIQKEIEKLEALGEPVTQETSDEDALFGKDSEIDTDLDFADDLGLEEPETENTAEEPELETEEPVEEEPLPSGTDLGVDLTNSNSPEFQ